MPKECTQGTNKNELKVLDSVLAFVKQKQTVLTPFFIPVP